MDVVARLLRLAAIGCSLLIVAGWGLFAIDETSAASKKTQAEIAGDQAASVPAPNPAQEAARAAAHGQLREAIDDANDVLLRPFAALGDSYPNRWVRRSVPAILALVVFGFGLAFLSRYAAGRW
jgi:hypothetical protein